MNKALAVIYILMFINLLSGAHLHGKPRDDHNFWITLSSVIINLILIWWALGWKFI